MNNREIDRIYNEGYKRGKADYPISIDPDTYRKANGKPQPQEWVDGYNAGLRDAGEDDLANYEEARRPAKT